MEKERGLERKIKLDEEKDAERRRQFASRKETMRGGGIGGKGFFSTSLKEEVRFALTPSHLSSSISSASY